MEKGKEYDFDTGKLLFEGEYLNGEKSGKGKEYNYYKTGKLLFEGEYLYDQRIKGKIYLKEKIEYEGDFLYNKKWNGKGFDENGNIIYELNNGNGTIKEYNYYTETLLFEGEYLNGKKNGTIKQYYN